MIKIQDEDKEILKKYIPEIDKELNKPIREFLTGFNSILIQEGYDIVYDDFEFNDTGRLLQSIYDRVYMDNY